MPALVHARQRVETCGVCECVYVRACVRVCVCLETEHTCIIVQPLCWSGCFPSAVPGMGMIRGALIASLPCCVPFVGNEVQRTSILFIIKSRFRTIYEMSFFCIQLSCSWTNFLSEKNQRTDFEKLIKCCEDDIQHAMLGAGSMLDAELFWKLGPLQDHVIMAFH